MSKRRSPISRVGLVPGFSRSAAGAAAGRRGWVRSVWLAALVVGATSAAYLPALKAGFIWNDSDYVTAPELRSLDGLARIWFELGATEQYYPLLHSAFWVEHRLWGDAALGYHLVNLLLHASSACLLALFLRRLLAAETAPPRDLAHPASQPNEPAGGQDRAATASNGTKADGAARTAARPPGVGPMEPTYAGREWLAAALFALHPVGVASVAWISEQKNTLSTLFYLAAALAYLRFAEKPAARQYLLASAMFAAALLTKTATATLPAALLVVFWWRRGRLEWKRDVQPLLPWLVLGAAAGIFTSWVEGHHLSGRGIGAEGAEFDLTWTGRALLAGRAIWFYLGSLAWPFDLNFIYPRWTIDATVWWQWLFPLAVVAVTVGLWTLRRRDRTPLAVFLLFAGTLFPALGFVNLYGALYSRVWDHWQYLADLAPLALAGAVLARAGARTGPRFRLAGPALARAAAAGLGMALCVLLGVLTWRRCGDFRDNETLYRATLARNPDCWMAQNNLGEILARTPEGLPEALEHYAAAVRLNPGRAELHCNLASAFAKAGRLAEAVDEFRSALRLAPDYQMAHNKLGNTLARMDDRLPEAISHLKEALRLDPTVPDVQNNLGIALLMAGRTQEAIAHFEAALRLNPNLPEAHMNLGAAWESLGRSAEAKAEFGAALRLRPDLDQAKASLEQLERNR